MQLRKGGDFGKIQYGGDIMPNTVLLTEDDIFLREGITELLKNSGYTVFAAATKQQTEAALSFCKPDIIILDVLLPDGSGIDIRVKAGTRNESVHIPNEGGFFSVFALVLAIVIDFN